MTIVTAEKFISTIPGKTNSDLPARQFANECGRDLGRVGEGFIIDILHARNDIKCLLRIHIQIHVIRPKILRHIPRISCFVISRFIETNSECLHRDS